MIVNKTSALGTTQCGNAWQYMSGLQTIEEVVAFMRPALRVRRGELAKASTSRRAIEVLRHPPKMPRCAVLPYRLPNGSEFPLVTFLAER